jgi:ketosteroid isomerase-like protein
MSQQNIEVVRAIYDDWLRGGMSIDKFDPEIAMVESKTIPRAPVACGIDAVRRYMDSFCKYWSESAWEGFRSRAQEYRQPDDERVLVLTLYRGRGKTSGVELEQMQAKGAGVAHIHDGKVTKLVWYTDRDDAVADLGLEE